MTQTHDADGGSLSAVISHLAAARDHLHAAHDAATALRAAQEPEPEQPVLHVTERRTGRVELVLAGAHGTAHLQALTVLWWLERWAGIDAARITVVLVNDALDAGPYYFSGLRIIFHGRPIRALDGRHVIVPRGVLPLRCWVGPDADKLRRWEMVTDAICAYGVEGWARPLLLSALAHIDKPTERVVLGGVWDIGTPAVKGDSSLAGSHGGWNVYPYGGGPLCWHAGCIESWQLAETMMLRTVMRSPIALSPRITPGPYWLGRTLAHEPRGYRGAVDDWCPYAQELRAYRPHNAAHLWRQIRDAAQLAPHDAFARWWLRQSWRDCQYALESTADGENERLLWGLTTRLARTPRGDGAWWADRSFAHVVRCFIVAEPYLEPTLAAHWRERLTGALRHILIPGTGVAMARDAAWDGFPQVPPPVAVTFQADLLGLAMQDLGMEAEAEMWRRFYGQFAPTVAQVVPGKRHVVDCLRAGVHPAEYDSVRGDLSAFGPHILNVAASRTVAENPLDWTPPRYWRGDQQRL